MWFWLLVAFIVGAVLALLMVPVLARTAAIAAPASLFAWFKGHGLLSLALFSWAALVVYGLSIALPAAVALVLLFCLYQRHHTASAASLGFGVLFSLYILVPLYSGQPSGFPPIFQWWQHGLLASLLLASGIALGVSQVFRITNPFKRTRETARGLTR